MTDTALQVAALKSKAWPFEEARKIAKRYPQGKRDASGALVPVLMPFLPTGQTLQAVYPHRRHLAGKVRALIDHLVIWFQRNPVH